MSGHPFHRRYPLAPSPHRATRQWRKPKTRGGSKPRFVPVFGADGGPNAAQRLVSRLVGG